MSTEEKVQGLNEQLEDVYRVLEHGPLIVWVTCVVGGSSLGLTFYSYGAGYFGTSVLAVGLFVFMLCFFLVLFISRLPKANLRN